MAGKEKLNHWSWKDYLKNGLMLALKLPGWALQAMCFWLPLKRNRITIYSLKQRGFSCNLKYLTLALQQEPGLEYLWVVRREPDAQLLRQRGIPVALLHSKEHFWWRMRSKTVVTNDEFYPVFYKRRGQVYVNTWHGGINYKKIGYEGLEFDNPLQKRIYQMNNPQPEHFLSGSRSFTDTASRAFGFPREIFREWGLPRNDLMYRGTQPQLREALGLATGTKAVLYAPTFRKGGVGPARQLDHDRLRQSLERRFGGQWVVLVRQHYFVAPGETEEGVLNVSEHEDMQELLATADVLISDYSSAMWDYLLTGRPCFVFAPDMEDYGTRDRAFFLPPDTWPWPLSTDTGSLCRAIEAFDEEAFRAAADAHRAQQGSFDSGCAGRKLLELLKNISASEGEKYEKSNHLRHL